jgi:hypothetical protein
VPETIKWSVTFEAVLGPRVAEAGELVVGAYDKVSVLLAGNATDLDVDVQPSATSGDLELLVLKAGKYDAGVTYSADAGATHFDLDGPVALIGTGAVALLGAAPQTLRFSNPSADPVDIEILAGRQA